MQCEIETPEGRPADSILSNIIIPVSQERSTNAQIFLASFLAIDILKKKKCDKNMSKEIYGAHVNNQEVLFTLRI